MQEKYCPGCDLKKPISEFSLASSHKDGLQHICKICDNNRRAERQRLFKEIVAEIKLQRGCADCGYNAHPDALDFDHLPGFEKKFEIARGWAYNWDKVLDEIAKCEVVCANCHRIRTCDRRNAND